MQRVLRNYEGQNKVLLYTKYTKFLYSKILPILFFPFNSNNHLTIWRNVKIIFCSNTLSEPSNVWEPKIERKHRMTTFHEFLLFQSFQSFHPNLSNQPIQQINTISYRSESLHHPLQHLLDLEKNQEFEIDRTCPPIRIAVQHLLVRNERGRKGDQVRNTIRLHLSDGCLSRTRGERAVYFGRKWKPMVRGRLPWFSVQRTGAVLSIPPSLQRGEPLMFEEEETPASHVLNLYFRWFLRVERGDNDRSSNIKTFLTLKAPLPSNVFSVRYQRRLTIICS